MSNQPDPKSPAGRAELKALDDFINNEKALQKRDAELAKMRDGWIRANNEKALQKRDAELAKMRDGWIRCGSTLGEQLNIRAAQLIDAQAAELETKDRTIEGLSVDLSELRKLLDAQAAELERLTGIISDQAEAAVVAEHENQELRAERERLKAELARSHQHAADLRAKLATERTEVERLRTVMAEVASMAGRDWLAGQLMLAEALNPFSRGPKPKEPNPVEPSQPSPSAVSEFAEATVKAAKAAEVTPPPPPTIGSVVAHRLTEYADSIEPPPDRCPLCRDGMPIRGACDTCGIAVEYWHDAAELVKAKAAWDAMRQNKLSITYHDGKGETDEGWEIAEPDDDGCFWALLQVGADDPVDAVLAAKAAEKVAGPLLEPLTCPVCNRRLTREERAKETCTLCGPYGEEPEPPPAPAPDRCPLCGFTREHCMDMRSRQPGRGV